MIQSERYRLNLKKLFKDLECLKRPTFPDSDDLAELVELIIELDPYYAGLASSVAEGTRINVAQLYDLNELKSKAKMIIPKSFSEEEIYKQCNTYINLFNQISTTILKATSE